MEQIIDVKSRTADMIVAEIKATEDYAARSVILAAAKIGQNLKELKELVGHGKFLPYIAENLEYSERKAQQMMQIAEHYADENSSYFRVVSNPHTCADLSISKALRLLAVPEEEVEAFVEENDPADLTVKELEEKISSYKSDVERLEQRLKESTEAQAAKLDEIEWLKSKMEEIDSDREGDAEEVKAAHEALEKAEREKAQEAQKAEKLKEKVDQLKTEQAEAIRKAQEEAEQAAAERAKEEVKAELERLQAEAEAERQKAEAEAEKAKVAEERLKAVSSAEKARMKAAAALSIRGKLMQDTFKQIVLEVSALEAGPEREQLKAAIVQILEGMMDRAAESL